MLQAILHAEESLCLEKMNRFSFKTVRIAHTAL